jgi:hypothetical protein
MSRASHNERAMAAQLRLLAHAHAEGLLSSVYYRRQRSALLDALPLEGSSSVRPRSRSRSVATRAMLAWIISAALVLLPQSAILDRGSAPQNAAALPHAAPNGASIQACLQPLLGRQDWTNAQVMALNAALLEAGAPRIEAMRTAIWFAAFATELRRRITAEQASRGGGLTSDRSPLLALGVTLGIDMAPDQPLAPDRPNSLHPHSAVRRLSGHQHVFSAK